MLCYLVDRFFLGGSDSKESACNAGDLGSTPGLGRSPGEKMAAHSSILAWEIPWTEKPVQATVNGVSRVGHDLVTKLPLLW